MGAWAAPADCRAAQCGALPLPPCCAAPPCLRCSLLLLHNAHPTGLSPEAAKQQSFIASMGIYVFKKELMLDLLDKVRRTGHAVVTGPAAVTARRRRMPLAAGLGWAGPFTFTKH